MVSKKFLLNHYFKHIVQNEPTISMEIRCLPANIVCHTVQYPNQIIGYRQTVFLEVCHKDFNENEVTTQQIWYVIDTALKTPVPKFGEPMLNNFL